jgi:low temperature requirement protein LtrA
VRTNALVVLALWLAAVFILWLPQRASTEQSFEIAPAHFVERHGLVIIIALGESVIAVATGTSEHSLGVARLGVATLGLLLSVALWWVYFDHDDTAALEALERAPATERPWKVKVGYGYWHYALLLGIIAAAAGMKDAVSAPFHHLHVPAALALAGGVAIYLTGHAGFRRTILDEARSSRLHGASFAALATVPLGLHGTAVLQLAALVLVVSVTVRRASATSRA